MFGRFDYKSENNSILTSIDINDATVKRYNQMVEDGMFEQFKEVSYEQFLSEGRTEKEADILSSQRATSMLISRALELNSGRLWIKGSSSSGDINTFHSMYDMRSKAVKERTAEGILREKTKEITSEEKEI